MQGPPDSLSQFAYELLTGAKEPVDWEKELRQTLHSLIAWVTASDPEGPLPQAIARGDKSASCRMIDVIDALLFNYSIIAC